MTTRKTYGKRLMASAVALMTTMLIALPALAGSIEIRDQSDALTSAQEDTLRATGGQYPFDVRVVTSDAHASRNAFDKFVGGQVSAPNMVVVGLDPKNHRTSVHFGTSTRIAGTEYKAIEDAGDSFFRSRDFQGGVNAILDRAAKAVGSGAVLAPGLTRTSGNAAGNGAGMTTATREAPKSSGMSWLIPLLGVGLIVGIVAMAFAARRRAEQAQMGVGPGGGYGNAPYGGGPPLGGGYGPGYGGPGPGYYGGGGGSGIGGNIMSAGLGGLVGYQLGKAAGDDHHHDHGGGAGGGYSSGNESQGGGETEPSYDAGGSTSDWDGGGGDGGDFGGGGDVGGGGDW